VSLAYDRAGAGPPLVLLHPLGANRHVWRPVLPLLTPHRDCVAVDLPGFGDSPPLTGATDPAALARAVAELLDTVRLDRPHVAGNSLGGWVALELALAGHAASVTAIAPAGLWRKPLEPTPEVWRVLSKATRPLLPALVRSARGRHGLLANSMAHPERVPPEDVLALARAYVDGPGYAAVNRAMRAGTFGPLDRIHVPVTLAWPEFDRVVTRVDGTPPNVRVVTLRGCGHVPMWDDPQQVADALMTGSGD
jgi:pimeloyl-ACP methyl ester carboxylesterase